jgi:hypothetical protein
VSLTSQLAAALLLAFKRRQWLAPPTGSVSFLES